MLYAFNQSWICSNVKLCPFFIVTWHMRFYMYITKLILQHVTINVRLICIFTNWTNKSFR